MSKEMIVRMSSRARYSYSRGYRRNTAHLIAAARKKTSGELIGAAESGHLPAYLSQRVNYYIVDLLHPT